MILINGHRLQPKTNLWNFPIPMSYKQHLIQYLSAYFDIEKHPVFHAPFTFEFKAIYRQINQKYIFTKEWVYDECKSNEYVLFLKPQEFPAFQDIKDCLQNNHEHIMTIDNSHMASFITLIVEIDCPLSEDTIKHIEKFHFYKSFLLGFKGWVNARLIVIDTRNKTGYANKFGKKELPGYLGIIP